MVLCTSHHHCVDVGGLACFAGDYEVMVLSLPDQFVRISSTVLTSHQPSGLSHFRVVRYGIKKCWEAYSKE
ncbi:MAG: hypothetical protein SPD11_06755, partial [Sphaerochaetaceae bacterium]|nr:hypothetical protein [Sphaerochaetaceae bacterium]